MTNKTDKQHELDKRYLRMASIWAENSYCKRRQVGCQIDLAERCLYMSSVGGNLLPDFLTNRNGGNL